MSRLLFILAIIAVVYFLFKTYFKQSGTKEDTPVSSEDMVRCAQCGVHMPKSESILAGGHFYCSDEHRVKHESK
ncbi:MAG: PP0621 family protein [Sideroxydans sp.]|nr:PP0621 family protein [Sideroxydans sp.]